MAKTIQETTKQMTVGRRAERVFHYTAAVHVQSILRDGFIKLATELVPVGERPAAWLSTNPCWEGTATENVLLPSGQATRLTRVSEMARYLVPARIEVDPARLSLVNWKEFKRTSGIDARAARGLERAAKETFGSDPYQYRCSYEPIPSSAFIRIEYWKDWKWYPWPPPQAGADALRIDVAA